MKHCAEYDHALWQAAETGDVPDGLAAYLAVCPPCRHELAVRQRAMAGFAALRTVEAPQTTAFLSIRSARPWSWRLVPVAAALAILLLGGLLVFLKTGARQIVVRELPSKLKPISIAKPQPAPSPVVVRRLPAPPITPSARSTVHPIPKRPGMRIAPEPEPVPPHVPMQEEVIETPVSVPEPDPVPDVIAVYGEPFQPTAEDIANAIPVDDIHPLDAEPIGYVVTELGEEGQGIITLNDQRIIYQLGESVPLEDEGEGDEACNGTLWSALYMQSAS